MSEDEDPWAAPYDTPADYLQYLRDRQNLAAEFRVRVAGALTEAAAAQKALARVVEADRGDCDGDIGGDADDAVAEITAAGRHLRNAFRVAIGHERDLRDEIAAVAADDEEG